MSFFTFSALFFPVMFGGLSVLAFKLNPKSLRLMLAFSGAFLIALSFTHIIPHLYHEHSGMEQYYGLFILGGFFFSYFSTFFQRDLSMAMPTMMTCASPLYLF